ncbi:hypothetical protein [Kribbella sp. NPDC006257]|uniref:hypothetical protein n=1 Tax=Kribbella sp. NPDC006257 TaxID=3156738 RepID=UPI0033A1E6CA
MPDIAVSNVLVSAGVAAFTTLAIEFTAKPWLEARKERILQQHRDRRELARKLRALETKIVGASGALRARTVDELLPGLIEASDALAEERNSIVEYCPPEIVLLINYQLGYGSGRLHSILEEYRRSAKAAAEDPESNDDYERQAAERIKKVFAKHERWFDIPVDYLRTPSSHFIRRYLLIRAAGAEVEQKIAEDAAAKKAALSSQANTSELDS